MVNVEDQRLVYLAAYVAMLDANADPLAEQNEDLKRLKEIVSTRDGAWRLADGMRNANVDPSLFPDLANFAENEEGRKPDGETDPRQSDNTTKEKPDG
jgi:hypothetical protein